MIQREVRITDVDEEMVDLGELFDFAEVANDIVEEENLDSGL